MSGDVLEQQKVVIGGLVNVADVHAKKVLANYNPARTYNTNLENMKKCNAVQLESCAGIFGMKVRSDDGKDTKLYQNKDVLTDRLILKIESLFEAECSDCKAMYQNTIDSKPLLTCRLCLLGSHDCDQVKEKVASMSATCPAGSVWLCDVCLKKNDLDNMLAAPYPLVTSSNSTDADLSTIEEQEEAELEETGENERGGDRVSPRRGLENNQAMEERAQQKRRSKTPICELYKRRSCPHGRNGKNLVSGKQCEKLHPKRCFRFCDFGPRHKNGCNKGKRCQFWHPRLCKHSIKNQECREDGCTYQHLKFYREVSETRQDKVRTSYRRDLPIAAPPQAAGGSEQNPPGLRNVSLQSWDNTPYPPTINKPHNNISRDRKSITEESFLLKLIESMRAGFQEQIDELKKELVKPKDQTSASLPIGAPLPQQRKPLPSEPVNPGYRAVPGPGMVHPSTVQFMMAQQQQQQQLQQQQQWMNWNQSFPALSS